MSPRSENPRLPAIGFSPLCCDIVRPADLDYLNECRLRCDWLIVGVPSDEVLRSAAGELTMSLLSRFQVISSLAMVDEAVPLDTIDAFAIWSAIRFDVLFLEAGTEMTLEGTDDLRGVGVEVTGLVA